MTRILLLEDDKLFAETLADFLELEGFDVTVVLDPYSAVDVTYSNRFDLYLFDVNLPFESGFELLGKLRDGDDTTPTIFITSRADKESMLEGFGSGADDYLRKPVDLDELNARIHAILRRQDGSEYIQIGSFQMDIVSKCLRKGDEEIELGRRLFDLLHMLVSAHGHTVTTEEIMNRLWPSDKEPSYGALRVYITRLKKLFGDSIENVRGVGYRMMVQDNDHEQR